MTDAMPLALVAPQDQSQAAASSPSVGQAPMPPRTPEGAEERVRVLAQRLLEGCRCEKEARLTAEAAAAVAAEAVEEEGESEDS